MQCSYKLKYKKLKGGEKMNVNMNLNNVLAGQVQGNGIPFGNQQVNMNKGEFLNMLKMLMAENQNPMQLAQTENAALNPDILQLLAEGNTANLNVTDEINSVGEDKSNNSNDAESKEKATQEKAPADLYGMVQQLNYIMPNVVNNEFPAENILYGIPDSKYSQAVKNYVNFNASQNTKNPEHENQQQSVDPKTSDVLGDTVKMSTPKSNFSAEKLIAEIEGNRAKLKDEIDFKVNLLAANNKPFAAVEGDNKIITISDESSEIKSQVMSQVKDKIVFMSETKAGTNDAVKHVTMELHPHNLGKVDIKMAFEDNKITVKIEASNEETQKILLSNAGVLADILNKSSGTPVDIMVKSHDYQRENHVFRYDQNNEQQEQQNYSQNNDESHGHGRQKNNYSYSPEDSDSEEDSVFSQMINMRNIKLNV